MVYVLYLEYERISFSSNYKYTICTLANIHGVEKKYSAFLRREMNPIGSNTEPIGAHGNLTKFDSILQELVGI